MEKEGIILEQKTAYLDLKIGQDGRKSFVFLRKDSYQTKELIITFQFVAGPCRLKIREWRGANSSASLGKGAGGPGRLGQGGMEKPPNRIIIRKSHEICSRDIALKGLLLGSDKMYTLCARATTLIVFFFIRQGGERCSARQMTCNPHGLVNNKHWR